MITEAIRLLRALWADWFKRNTSMVVSGMLEGVDCSAELDRLRCRALPGDCGLLNNMTLPAWTSMMPCHHLLELRLRTLVTM